MRKAPAAKRMQTAAHALVRQAGHSGGGQRWGRRTVERGMHRAAPLGAGSIGEMRAKELQLPPPTKLPYTGGVQMLNANPYHRGTRPQSNNSQDIAPGAFRCDGGGTLK